MNRFAAAAVLAVFPAIIAGCSRNDGGIDPDTGPAPAPVITTETIPVWVENQAFSATITASGGSGQGFGWFIRKGVIPAGLALTASGTPSTVLSGTPAESGVFRFELEVTDSAGASGRREFEMEVLEAGTLFIITESCVSGAAGIAYGQDLEAVGGTGAGYTWSLASGTLPPGLTLDGCDGVLSWGTFSLTGNIDRTWPLENANELNEVSGVAASKAHSGVLWVHDDSWWWGTPGNPANPYFYAIDDQGNVLQKYKVGSYNRDWEDICIGPGPDPETDYLYIGDVGDNNLVRTDLRIIRVKEPCPPSSRQPDIAVQFDEFWFQYPSGARDCETMLMDRETGILYLVDKNAGGNVFKFPGPMDHAWTSTNRATLVLVKTGLQPSGNNTITGGDASRDSRRVILRGYGANDMWEFARPASGTFDSIFNQVPSVVPSVGGNQFEAVAYSGTGTFLYTLTENAPQPIYRAPVNPGPYDTTISGTPTAQGDYYFVIRVTDSAGETATRAYWIRVG